MIHRLWRIFSSPPIRASRPPTVGLAGKDQPRPRKSSGISTSDEHSALRHDSADRQVGGVITAQRPISSARRRFLINEHCLAALDDLALIAGWVHEGPSLRNMWWRIRRCAPHRSRWTSLDVHVTAQ